VVASPLDLIVAGSLEIQQKLHVGPFLNAPKAGSMGTLSVTVQWLCCISRLQSCGMPLTWFWTIFFVTTI